MADSCLEIFAAFLNLPGGFGRIIHLQKVFNSFSSHDNPLDGGKITSQAMFAPKRNVFERRGCSDHSASICPVRRFELSRLRREAEVAGYRCVLVCQQDCMAPESALS
jgi:hypothetical protein